MGGKEERGEVGLLFPKIYNNRPGSCRRWPNRLSCSIGIRPQTVRGPLGRAVKSVLESTRPRRAFVRSEPCDPSAGGDVRHFSRGADLSFRVFSRRRAGSLPRGRRRPAARPRGPLGRAAKPLATSPRSATPKRIDARIGFAAPIFFREGGSWLSWNSLEGPEWGWNLEYL